MRITRATIKHLLGIEELSLECGRITEITGSNGSGKTSILEGFKAALGGGNLAKIRNVHSDEEPEVVLVLDEGRLRVEKRGDKTAALKERVGDSAYKDVKQPQTVLDGLFDPELSNPVRFLTAKPEARADLLLEVLPLNLDRAALQAHLGDAWPAGRQFPEGHPLQVIAAARLVMFEERTGVNRSQKDKASSAYELRKALPAEFPADPARETARVQEQRDALVAELAGQTAAAREVFNGAEDIAVAECDRVTAEVEGGFKAEAAKIRGKLEADIAALKEKAEAEIQEKRSAAQAKLAAAAEANERAAAAAVATRDAAIAAVEARRPEVSVLSERLATLRQIGEEVARLTKTKELADRFDKEAAELEAMSSRLTDGIDRLDREKHALAKDLPIEGLEVYGTQILVNGVPFDQLNTAQRIRIAVKVATLRARAQTLTVLFVDGSEALVGEDYELLVKELEASGVQAFIARAEPAPLRVETVSKPADVVLMPSPDARPKRRQAVLSE